MESFLPTKNVWLVYIKRIILFSIGETLEVRSDL